MRSFWSLVQVIVAVVLLVGAWAWGFATAELELEPYDEVMRTAWELGESPTGQRLRFQLKGQQEQVGRFRKARDPAQSDDAALEIARLEALGYVDGSVLAEDGAAGVVALDSERSWPGLNLVTSGHEAGATLMTLDGKSVHHWHKTFAEIFPDESPPPGARGLHHWRKVHLLEDGGLLVIFEGLGLARLDRDSNVVWAHANHAHHDFDVHPDGRIFVLTRVAHRIERLHPHRPLLEDFITVYSPAGEQLERYSLLEAIRGSAFQSLEDFYNIEEGDPLHTNTLVLLDGAHADRYAWDRPGNVLVSFPMLNTVAVVDLDPLQVVWTLAGISRFQHDPSLLDNGHVLLLDNKGHDGHSKVVEVDPASGEIVWSYLGDDSNDFYTATCGTAQRLPNGNTLVTESDPGRAFELTPDGLRTWEYRNPERVGEQGELVATLFEVERLDHTAPLSWLPEAMRPPTPPAAEDADDTEGLTSP